MCQRLLERLRLPCAVHNRLHRMLLACSWLALYAALNTASAADDFKVIKLEQDVRNLERQVQELTRQVADLQQRSSRTSTQVTRPDNRASGVQASSSNWLVADNWKQVHPGMSEMDVIRLLGPPTTMRGAADGADRQLFYALEIGPNGFLSGSITLKDRKVTVVELPTLK